MSRIAFITLFLGIVAGSGPVELTVDPGIRTVSIFLDRREVAKIKHAPWNAVVDFGESIVPRELVAVGYDADGAEVARTSQILNLQRPDAEMEIVADYENEVPVAVRLVGRHFKFVEPKNASITFDGRPLSRGFSARLPKMDGQHSHIVAAEMKFRDGAVARKELVINGGYFDSSGSELTPIAVRTADPAKPARLSDCFSFGAAAVRTAAVEKPEPLVTFVQEPNARANEQLLRKMKAAAGNRRQELLSAMELGRDTSFRIMWPMWQEYRSGSDPTSVLFLKSSDERASDISVIQILSRSFHGGFTQQFKVANAVAVAGVQMLNPPRRRAVVLVLGNVEDRSDHQPIEVCRYLDAIGVPLFVWSLTGPRPDLATLWGDVEDVSTLEKLSAAVAKLRATLESQQIVWLATDPLTALNVSAKPECGVVPLAFGAGAPFSRN